MHLRIDSEEPGSNIGFWTLLRSALAGGYLGMQAPGPKAPSSWAARPWPWLCSAAQGASGIAPGHPNLQAQSLSAYSANHHPSPSLRLRGGVQACWVSDVILSWESTWGRVCPSLGRKLSVIWQEFWCPGHLKVQTGGDCRLWVGTCPHALWTLCLWEGSAREGQDQGPLQCAAQGRAPLLPV